MVDLPYPTATPRTPGSLAPATLEQWAHDFALTQANRLANGTIDGSPEGLFSNVNAAKFGMSPFDPADIGSGVVSGAADTKLFLSRAGIFDPADIGSGFVSGAAYNQLFQMGMTLAKGGYAQLTPQQRAGLSDPTGLKSAGPGDSLTDQDRKALTDLAITNLQEAGASARNAADIASRMSIAQLQEAGASARNAQRIAADLQMNSEDNATQRYGIDVTAAVNREDIGARERIAASDRASREGIATADRTESGRQFDLGLGEDRRQFNASMLFELFDRGIALMQNPVDWLGYQYWLGNVGAPINALTLSSAAAIGGAIPPSGPSAAGPVIGGPAVLDGDFSGAEQLGIQNAGPVSVAEAIQMHPGGAVTGDPSIAASSTITQYGTAEEVDQALAQSRATELEGQVSPQFIQQSRTIAQNLQTQQLAGTAPVVDPATGAVSPVQQGTPATQTGLPPLPGGTVAPDDQRNPAQPGGVVGEAMPAPPMIDPATGQPVAPAVSPVQPQPLTNLAGAVPGGTGGIFTGNEASGTPEAAAAVPGQPQTSNTNIEQLLGALATELGIPIDQLRQIFPANLMPGQATNGAIANSPVMQMLKGGAPVSSFNTGPTSGSPFTSIAAPTGGGRIETGVRGGQDVNATSYLTSLPSTQQQAQGVIRAQGQNVPDFQEQLLRSAPLTNVSSGSYGRRRF